MDENRRGEAFQIDEIGAGGEREGGGGGQVGTITAKGPKIYEYYFA